MVCAFCDTQTTITCACKTIRSCVVQSWQVLVNDVIELAGHDATRHIRITRITDASNKRRVFHFDGPYLIEQSIAYRMWDAVHVLSRIVACGNPCCFRHRVDRGDAEHIYCMDHWDITPANAPDQNAVRSE